MRDRSESNMRNTLLEDHVGRTVVCHLHGKTIRGVLKRVSRYEIEVETGDKLIVISKHSLVYATVLRGRPSVHRSGGGR